MLGRFVSVLGNALSVVQPAEVLGDELFVVLPADVLGDAFLVVLPAVAEVAGNKKRVARPQGWLWKGEGTVCLSTYEVVDTIEDSIIPAVARRK